ncbi:fosfomycin resistance glutathione transferase [Shewanella cyperi]|uniref:Fosfomycin resistance glutathione transferase n=1 Tax=Shewanella cyperi TaxID=2814292 RepID=A0A974XNR1_9GAMM|nr:fosfomycin resistance glutathione transferase [Shewanella cyperi]QSX31805.1 fosfomycin resistance glutathione transferase [Shewanella cyperi]
MLTGLNHLTLAVTELDTSLAFYVDLLGMQAQVRWDNGAYLSLGTLWLCLSCDAALPARDYSHIAFDIAEADFPGFAARLRSAGVREWKHNRSEGQSLYLQDPDGHQLEIHVGSLQSRLAVLKARPYPGLQWL